MKALSLVLRILAIAGAALAIVGWVMTNNAVKDANAATEKANGQVKVAQKELADVEQKLDSAESRNKALESDLADYKSRASSARSQLAEAQRNASQLKREIASKESEIANLDSQNTRLKKEIIDARTDVPEIDPAEIQNYQTEIANLSRELDEMKDKLALATRKSSSSTVDTATEATAVPLGPTPITTASIDGASGGPMITSTAKLPGTTTASVIDADVKNGMVIISRGQKQGLQEQMEFGIAKGFDKPVRVKVAKAQPDYSLAYILPGSEGAKFAAGDEVTLLR